jgi:hypothetical protein
MGDRQPPGRRTPPPSRPPTLTTHPAREPIGTHAPSRRPAQTLHPRPTKRTAPLRLSASSRWTLNGRAAFRLLPRRPKTRTTQMIEYSTRCRSISKTLLRCASSSTIAAVTKTRSRRNARAAVAAPPQRISRHHFGPAPVCTSGHIVTPRSGCDSLVSRLDDREATRAPARDSVNRTQSRRPIGADLKRFPTLAFDPYSVVGRWWGATFS